MINEADAVVVGSGGLGASTTYHLAKLGRRVALVDRHALGSQTSPRAAGLTLQVQPDPLLSRIAIRGVEKIASFTAETGEALTFQRGGSIKLARTAADAEQVRREVVTGKEMGVEIDLISPAEARRLAPWLQAEKAHALWYTPSDLYLEPGQLPLAYARAAERLGATLVPQTAVTAIVSRAGAVERVVTDRGEIRTPVVIDAAGAWTRPVADLLGIRVPLVPTRHQLYVTRPLLGVAAGQPIVRVLDARVYVRPERGGLMLGGYEPDPLQVEICDRPAPFEIADLELDFAPLRALTERVREEFPVLAGAEIAEHRGGLPTITADGTYILDHVPGVEGFYLIGGCNVGGLTTAPALGEALAAWIVDGEVGFDLSRFRLTRFGPATASEEGLRAACLRTYAHKYSPEEVAHA